MATWQDVRGLALALPETQERPSYQGTTAWQVRGKGFTWERPLGKADLAELGVAAPGGPVLAAYLPDLGAKEALLTDDPEVYFTTSHFDGYPVVLVRLERIPREELAELVTEAWLARAPKRLARDYLGRAG